MNIFKCIIIILPLGFAKNVGFSDFFFLDMWMGQGLPVGGREARERERRERRGGWGRVTIALDRSHGGSHLRAAAHGAALKV